MTDLFKEASTNHHLRSGHERTVQVIRANSSSLMSDTDLVGFPEAVSNAIHIAQGKGKEKECERSCGGMSSHHTDTTEAEEDEGEEYADDIDASEKFQFSTHFETSFDAQGFGFGSSALNNSQNFHFSKAFDFPELVKTSASPQSSNNNSIRQSNSSSHHNKAVEGSNSRRCRSLKSSRSGSGRTGSCRLIKDDATNAIDDHPPRRRRSGSQGRATPRPRSSSLTSRQNPRRGSLLTPSSNESDTAEASSTQRKPRCRSLTSRQRPNNRLQRDAVHALQSGGPPATPIRPSLGSSSQHRQISSRRRLGSLSDHPKTSSRRLLDRSRNSDHNLRRCSSTRRSLELPPQIQSSQDKIANDSPPDLGTTIGHRRTLRRGISARKENEATPIPLEPSKAPRSSRARRRSEAGDRTSPRSGLSRIGSANNHNPDMTTDTPRSKRLSQNATFSAIATGDIFNSVHATPRRSSTLNSETPPSPRKQSDPRFEGLLQKLKDPSSRNLTANNDEDENNNKTDVRHDVITGVSRRSLFAKLKIGSPMRHTSID